MVKGDWGWMARQDPKSILFLMLGVIFVIFGLSSLASALSYPSNWFGISPTGDTANLVALVSLLFLGSGVLFLLARKREKLALAGIVLIAISIISTVAVVLTAPA